MTSTKCTFLSLLLALGCAGRSELDLLPGEPDKARDGGGGSEPTDASRDATRADAMHAGPSEEPPDASAGTTDAGAVDPRGPVLRYDFAGTGSTLRDRVGQAHAQILGGALLDGSGELLLDGTDDYVDLPNDVLAPLTSTTIVVWFEWLGGVCWQRVFDFGSSNAGEGEVGQAISAWFFTPLACGDTRSLLMAEFGALMFQAAGVVNFPVEQKTQVVAVYDGERRAMRLYHDGVLMSETEVGFALSDIDGANNWLGRSQWVQDRFAHMRYDEFRVYPRALSAEEIAELAQDGPEIP